MTHVIPDHWDHECDLVVVGFGGAGATCAVRASELGADVIVLEKGSQGGGNSACIAGSLVLAVDDRQRSYEYVDWLCGGQTPPEIINAYLDGLGRLRDFQVTLGFEVRDDHRPFRSDGFYPEFPDVPGAGGLLGTSYIRAPGGDGLWTAISNKALAQGARLFTGTPATDLVQDPATNEVLGVLARDTSGQTLTVRGRKGVVLATGGFEFNEEMRRQYVGHFPSLFLGSKNLTGDGILMAQKAGAKLWHMNSVTGPIYWGIKTPDDDVYVTYEFMSLAGFGYKAPVFTNNGGGLLWVNKAGRRFTNETIDIATLHHGWKHRAHWMKPDDDGMGFPNVPAWQVFDHKTFIAGPALTTLNSRTPKWSEDNSRELASGLIIAANTLEDLAAKMITPYQAGVSVGGPVAPDDLTRTIDEYNAACAVGEDREFGRENFLVPLDAEGPYYAIGPMVPTYVNTHGGPEHNAQQQVVGVDGAPIPGLYAIGECGSMWGPYYNSMADICEFLISGLTAAEAALT